MSYSKESILSINLLSSSSNEEIDMKIKEHILNISSNQVLERYIFKINKYEILKIMKKSSIYTEFKGIPVKNIENQDEIQDLIEERNYFSIKIFNSELNYKKEQSLLSKSLHSNIISMIEHTSNSQLFDYSTNEYSTSSLPCIVYENHTVLDFYSFLIYNNASEMIPERILRLVFIQILLGLHHLLINSVDYSKIDVKSIFINEKSFEIKLKIPEIQYEHEGQVGSKESLLKECFDFNNPPENNSSMKMIDVLNRLYLKDKGIQYDFHGRSDKYSQSQSVVYQLGIVLFNLSTLRDPFIKNMKSKLFDCSLSKQDRHKKFWSSIQLKNTSLSNELKDLITKMLEYDVDERISLENVLNHDWVYESILQEGNEYRLNISQPQVNDYRNFFIERYKKYKAYEEKIYDLNLIYEINNNRNDSLTSNYIIRSNQKKIVFETKKIVFEKHVFSHFFELTLNENQFKTFICLNLNAFNQRHDDIVTYLLNFLHEEKVEFTYETQENLPLEVKCNIKISLKHKGKYCLHDDEVEVSVDENDFLDDVQFNIRFVYVSSKDLYLLYFISYKTSNLYVINDLISRLREKLHGCKD